MSKLDIGVGDEFPLDEPRDDHNAGRRGRHRMHRHMHGHHHMHGHRHHRRFGLGRFALLLVIAGLVALIVNHQMTAAMAYGLVGTGAGLLVLSFAVHAVWHWRHHRRMHQQVS